LDRTLRGSLCWLVWAIVAIVAVARDARAQALHGLARDEGTGAPIAGVVVSALDSGDVLVSRTIANGDGQFRIGADPRVKKLRLIRIGYSPAELLVSAGKSELGVVEMTRLPPILEAMRISDRELCPGSADRGAAFQLWEQARAGLLVTVVARQAKPALVTTLQYQQELSPQDDHVRTLTVQRKTAQSTRPFIAAAAPSFFATHGYLIENASVGRVFNAPDADVFLDESFAATHCFHRQQPDSAHRGQTGLAFTPIGGRTRDTLVDVSGVLWLDDATPALRSMDFRYTALEPAARKARTGGHIDFRTMANGVSFIQHWELRLAALATDRSRTGFGAGAMSAIDNQRRSDRLDVRVTAIARSGGDVIDATWADGTVWHEAPTGVVGRIVAERSETPIRGAVVSVVGGTISATTDSAGAFSLAPLVPGKYTIVASDTTFRERVEARSTPREVQVTAERMTEVKLELQPFAQAVASLCRGKIIGFDEAVVNGVLALPVGSPDAYRIRARWLARLTSSASAGVAVDIREEIVAPDSHGRFLVCGVSRDRALTLTLTTGSRVVADTVIHLANAPSVRLINFRWTPSVAAATTNAATTNATTLRGSVSALASADRVSGTMALEGAEVTLIPGARGATTGADGSFVVRDLAVGDYTVQVKRVGYEAIAESLHVRGENHLERDFVLRRVARIDTVKSSAAGQRSVSSGLRGFEERRAIVTGGFTDDSTITARQLQYLADLLSSLTPGQLILRGLRGGTSAGSSRARVIDTKPTTFGTGLPNARNTAVYLDGQLIYNPRCAGPRPSIWTRSISRSPAPSNVARGRYKLHPNSQAAPGGLLRSRREKSLVCLFGSERLARPLHLARFTANLKNHGATR
jgi:hypothetical protein